MKYVHVNLNDKIRFLVSEGAQEAYRQHQRKANAELFESHGMAPSPIRDLSVDHEGCAEMPLYVFMHVFGPYFSGPTSASTVNPNVLIEGRDLVK